ncbi:hypothetical protein KAFR_0K01530 [Kazachstania africana CBS 2517]|uniref:Nop domain-containing protein n=1 Tax=Kazachstania africana (strain ATCC 22294 / BCRC 22015 / CBS 2517 / CECT 1963 / NBRC 1671 / NRRL Y-8276) TaxID=1071382 RepID=H2B1K7_KAZAF|nr:hypothetical protein KAFR_0K01530 [Kazachstania africana CBS 2517]CCF60507.1 hypothetical protein KAFR_0K01530 [Kazachstania africana CBS 2517]
MSDEEDFLKDLEEDLEDFSANEEENFEQKEGSLSEANKEEVVKHMDGKAVEDDLTILKKSAGANEPFMLARADLVTIDPSSISNIYQLSSRISHILLQHNSKFTMLLPYLNQISLNLRTETANLHEYLKLSYSARFSELESLIATATQYSNVIYVLETSEKDTEGSLVTSLEQVAQLSKEQILVLMMSMKTSFNESTPLPLEIKQRLLRAREMIITLDELRHTIASYISSKVYHIAPNLCALLGSEITALLVSHAGDILQLSQVPNCNLASIGKKKHLSHELHTTASGVRQEGYIYNSELVQETPVGSRKQMLRMLCAKVALAARVDAGLNQSNPDDSLGRQWRDELLTKVKKINEAPNVSDTKALPIPEDKPKKKRAGRKFRKYKQQFQLSHLRQLQNRMEFGKQETSIMDAFGEEVGLGMTNTSMQTVSGIVGGSGRNVNNSAKMSKSMKQRIKDTDKQAKEYLISLNEFSNGTGSTGHSRPSKIQKQDPNPDHDWFSHHLPPS